MSYRAYPPPAIRAVGYDPVRDLPANHLAWLVESTVEAALQDWTLPPAEGQPPFDPRLCAKVLIYGYATGVRSSRLLQRNCEENLPFLFLTRGDTPSYRTLCSFRVNHAKVIEEIWLQLFVVAGKLGFKRLGRIVVDSSKFKADASAESVVKEDEYDALRQELRRILKEADQADLKDEQQSPGTTTLEREVKPEQMREILRRVRSEITAKKKKSKASLPTDPTDEAGDRPPLGPKMLERVVAALDTLDAAQQAGLKHACLTDPDARMMGEGRDKLIQECHSFEVVVDKDAQLLVAGQVTQEGNDNARLEPLLEAALPHEPEGIHSVDADSGYYKGEVIGRIEEQGVDTCIPDSVTAQRLKLGTLPDNPSSLQASSDPSVALTYDAERDVFVCAVGKDLVVKQQRQQGGRDVKIYATVATCTGCPLAAACLRKSTSKHRTTSRPVDATNPIDTALGRFTEEEHQERYHDRGMIVETVFGFLRHILGFDHWMVRGTARVAAEGKLFTTAYQFRKVYCAWALASAAK